MLRHVARSRSLLARWAAKARFFGLLWFTYAYFYQGSDPNQLTRIFLTQSLVERRAVDITAYHSFTIDKAEVGGAFFCDKAPGLSFLATPFWALQNLADRMSGFSPESLAIKRARLHFLVIFLCGTAGVIAAYALARVLRKLGATRHQEGLLVVGYALGTLAFPYSTALFAHQLVAALLIGTFALIFAADGPASTQRLVTIGALWALAIVSEYPSALLVAPLGLYLLWQHRDVRARLRTFGLVTAGAVPLLIAHSLYLKAAFGKFFELPYKHEFEPFFHMHHEVGIMGISLPGPAGLIGITVSRYRGLFFLCPFLLLVFFGVRKWLRDAGQRSERVLVVSMMAVYFLFTSSYYAWDGGGSTGPRHLVPVLPFVVIAILPFLRHGGRLELWVCRVLVALSVLLMFVSVAVLLHMPEGEVLLSNPVYRTIVPSFMRHELGLNSQDVRELGPRGDAAYTLGVLLGLGPWTSLAALGAVWALAYAPSWFARLRAPAMASG